MLVETQFNPSSEFLALWPQDCTSPHFAPLLLKLPFSLQVFMCALTAYRPAPKPGILISGRFGFLHRRVRVLKFFQVFSSSPSLECLNQICALPFVTMWHI